VLIAIHTQLNFNVKFSVILIRRNKAYLPNFNVIPANIIEPIVGAST